MDCRGVFLCAWGSIKTLDCSVIKLNTDTGQRKIKC
jgi:hypothetical protein